MMKDAYWFSHDSNAKDDPKIMLLIDQLGLEGYGIYWILVETLREQPGYRYPFRLLPILAKRFFTSAEKMVAVVQNYALFVVEIDEFFFSESLNRRMAYLEQKREQARIAGKKSGQMRRLMSATSNDRSTDVQQELNGCRTSKVKESKVNKNITPIPPSREDVIQYCKERGKDVDPQKWFDFYQSKGWMIGKSKMKDWEAAVRTWERSNIENNHQIERIKRVPEQDIPLHIPSKKLSL